MDRKNGLFYGEDMSKGWYFLGGVPQIPERFFASSQFPVRDLKRVGVARGARTELLGRRSGCSLGRALSSGSTFPIVINDIFSSIVHV